MCVCCMLGQVRPGPGQEERHRARITIESVPVGVYTTWVNVGWEMHAV